MDAVRGYRGFGRYGETKLANILFTAELARRLEGSGVTATCLHPGFVATGFNRNNGPLMAFGMTVARPFARSPERGADTLVWLANSAEAPSEGGVYYANRKRVTPSPAARDMASARRLWELSEAQRPRRYRPTPDPAPMTAPMRRWADPWGRGGRVAPADGRAGRSRLRRRTAARWR